MKLAVSTCDRKPEYIHDTLSSLILTSDMPVNIYVCGDKMDFLERWIDNPRLTFNPMDSKLWDEVKAKDPKYRNVYNLWRVVDGADPSENLMAFEDDIEVCDNWVMHLVECVVIAEDKSPDGYVITLFYGYNFGGKKLVPFPIDDYYGTQAVLINRKLFKPLAKFLKEQWIDKNYISADMGLKAFMKENNVPLYGTVPHLVQHMGMVSLCGGIPQSKEYRKDY